MTISIGDICERCNYLRGPIKKKKRSRHGWNERDILSAKLYYSRQRIILRGSEIRFKPSTSYFGIDIDSIRGPNIVQLLQRLFDKSFDVQPIPHRSGFSRGYKENMYCHWSVPSVKSTLIYCVNVTNILSSHPNNSRGCPARATIRYHEDHEWNRNWC